MWSISHNNTCAHMIYHYQCSQFGIDLFSSLFSLSWPCEYSAHMSISWPFLIRYLQVPSASIGFMYNILVMEVDIRTCHWNVGIVVSWFDTGKRPPFPQWAFIGPSKFLDLNHTVWFIVDYFPSYFQCILVYDLVAMELIWVVMMGPFLLSFPTISNVKMEFPEPLEPSFTTSTIQVLICNHPMLMAKKKC